jgi:hypothetical protein
MIALRLPQSRRFFDPFLTSRVVVIIWLKSNGYEVKSIIEKSLETSSLANKPIPYLMLTSCKTTSFGRGSLDIERSLVMLSSAVETARHESVRIRVLVVVLVVKERSHGTRSGRRVRIFSLVFST